MRIVGYVVSALIGFAVAHFFFEGASAAYASILISYHLYLAILVVSASHEKSLSMSIRHDARVPFGVSWASGGDRIWERIHPIFLRR